jgi:hypothetical protein
VSKKNRRGGTPRRKPWTPLVGSKPSAEYLDQMREVMRGYGYDDEKIESSLPEAVFVNDRYQVLVRMAGQLLHLSIHRNDRRAVRDWRELQQIKNEVAGPERFAFEVFPPESELADTSNEYHLWVLPEDVDPPHLMEGGRCVFDAASSTADRVAGKSKARQRPWTPGLTTGHDKEGAW